MCRLQDVISRGSEALYKATSGRVYFANVTIIVPVSWNNTNLTDTSPLTILNDLATILVEAFGKELPEGPTVKQGGRCGEPGEYMILPEAYVVKSETERAKRFGDTGRSTCP